MKPKITSLFRSRLLTVFAIALCTAPFASADLVISVTPTIVTAGTTGDSVDINLTNTGASAVEIGAFSFGLLANDPAVTFAGATAFTTNPYVFAVDSLFGPDIATTIGAALIASDVSSGDVVLAGSTVGLGHVLFDVASNVPASGFTISFSPAETSLADPLGGAILIDTLQAAQISVLPNSTVPESSAAWLIGGPLLLLALVRRRQTLANP